MATETTRLIPHLDEIFHEINEKWFEGKLPLCKIYWNSRIRTSAGRFYPGSRSQRFSFVAPRPPMIEIASYLQHEEQAMALIRDTLAHEMIHYWLWHSKRPFGHTAEFLTKMREMGVSRYNPVPKLRTPKYVYLCPNCRKEFTARKRWRSLACAECCKQHSGGKYDRRFKLELIRELTP